MTSPLYASLVAEASSLVHGSTVAPAANYARHEAGHVVVAARLGVTVRHATLLPSPCNPVGPHTCAPTEDPLLRAAIRWAGAVAERTLAWSSGDFADLADMKAHGYGPAFGVAERIIAAHGHEVDRVAAALSDPAREGILFAEDIAALLRVADTESRWWTRGR